MAAGRGRPGRARIALALWLFVLLLWLWFGPRGLGLLLVALGLYLVGPLWTPARYRIGDQGVERRTPFGTTALAWSALADFALAPDEGTAWVWRRGRGSARFLPPLLLLWDVAEAPDLAARVDAALAARLPRRGGRTR